MPWLETSPVEQRERFINDHRRGLYDMIELCARYAISRKTGYKWLARYDAGGRPALLDRSRAPQACPPRFAEPVAQLLLAARRRHPDWGPEKLLQWLEPRHPGVTWPAISTAGDLLARHGLVKTRRRRRPPYHPGVVPPVTHVPNDLWAPTSKASSAPGIGSTAIRSPSPTSTRATCSRATGCSRRGGPASGPSSIASFASMDCRGPFAPTTGCRSPPLLDGRTPGSRYRPSARPYTGVLPALEYPGHFLVKRVTNAGTIRFKTRLLYVSTALKQHRIGLEEVEDGIWSVFFCNVLLGRIDERQALVRGQLGVTHVPG